LEFIINNRVTAQNMLTPFKDEEEKEAFRVSMRTLIDRMGLGPNVIKSRGSFIHENVAPGATPGGKLRLFDFDNHGPQGASTSERMLVYAECIRNAFREAFADTEEAPADLVHTTCTGYSAPCPAQYLVSEKGWHSSTNVTHVYHHGCAAAIPTTRVAKSLVLGSTGGNKRCDVMHSEMDSIHCRFTVHDLNQTLIECLFADGAIKYSMQMTCPPTGGFRHIATHEMVIPNSLGDMTWGPGDKGFDMSITKDVPSIVVAALPGFLVKLNKKMGISEEEFDIKKVIFAIHPGGPKIVNGIAQVLELEPWQYPHAMDILSTRGNMSSCTLVHIWERMLADPNILPGTKIYSVAVAPGLTLAGCVFEKVVA
jgi:predicted naringenin-chalcone synthase